MDTDDVFEVTAPVGCSPKRKNKEVILQDVIEIDEDDSAAAMFDHGNIGRIIKGKAVKYALDGHCIHQSKEAVLHTSLGLSCTEALESVNGIEIAKDVAPASSHCIDLDGPNSDASADDRDNYTDTCYEEVDYAYLQSHFDNVGIPPGIEAPVPDIPSLSDSPKSIVSSVSGSSSVDTRCQMKSDYVGVHGTGMFPWTDPSSFNFKPTVVGSSSLKIQKDSICHLNGQYQSSWELPKAARSRKKQFASHPKDSAPSLPVGAQPLRSQRLFGALQRKKKLGSSSKYSSSKYSFLNKYDPMKFDTGVEASLFGYNLPNIGTSPFGLQSPSAVTSDSMFPTFANPHSSFYSPIGSIYPPGELAGLPWGKGFPQIQPSVHAATLSTTPARQLSTKEIDEIMQKYKGFKQFDTVEDHSDHHYKLSGTLNGNCMTPVSLDNVLDPVVASVVKLLGYSLNRQLAEAGAHVVMAVRNTKAAEELIQKWQTEWSGMGLPLNIEVMELDLLSLASVVRFSDAWNARLGPLHVLINNAGIFSIGEPQKFSKDGYEQHLQVNHLAPALLSVLLLPSLIRGSPSRIVNVNSVMHYVGFVDTDDMNFVSGKRKYTSLAGYSSSKLAQIMFSSVLHKQLPAEAGICVPFQEDTF
ncbi:Ubiquitin-conjugating enzyme [Orobanche minor]